jgi:hypothetical protein
LATKEAELDVWVHRRPKKTSNLRTPQATNNFLGCEIRPKNILPPGELWLDEVFSVRGLKYLPDVLIMNFAGLADFLHRVFYFCCFFLEVPRFPSWEVGRWNQLEEREKEKGRKGETFDRPRTSS